MRHILIARHGARLDSEDKNWKSRSKRPHDSPLSATGHMQAKSLAEHIKTTDTVIDYIFSSPLHRAIETAIYSARAMDCKIIVDGGLHEWFDPRAHAEVPGLLYYTVGLERVYGEIGNNDRYLVGNMQVELQKEMETRCINTIRSIINDYPCGNILIFTHGSPAREFISYLAGRRTSFPTEAGVRALRLDHDEEEAELVWSWKPECVVSGDGK